MGYGDFIKLPRRTASANVFCDKAFKIAKIQNMMDIKKVLLLQLINLLIKRPQVVVLKIKPRLSRRIKQINYPKISKTESKLVLYRQYLGC